jgi:aspartate/glutamate racemase
LPARREGAALCYLTICAEGAALLGPYAHPEVSLHGHSLAAYVACQERGDGAGIGELMLASAAALACTGADFLICPDNTIHQALTAILPRSPLPWLPIAKIVAAEAAARGYQRLGLSGTHLAGRWSGPSGGAGGARSRVPAPDRHRARRDRPHHHGRAGVRDLQA